MQDRDYITKCDCYIHSLKQGEKSVLAEATIIEKIGDNDYLAEYGGVRCHAIFNPFVCRYYVDDKYGIIESADAHDKNYLKNAELDIEGEEAGYGMIDGLINNTPKSEAAKTGQKPSVFDRLTHEAPKDHKPSPSPASARGEREL